MIPNQPLFCFIEFILNYHGRCHFDEHSTLSTSNNIEFKYLTLVGSCSRFPPLIHSVIPSALPLMFVFAY